MTLSNEEGDKVVMKYDAERHTLSFDRRESGLVDFSENFPAVTVSPTFEDKGAISLRLFIDRSSIEVFGDGGRFVDVCASIFYGYRRSNEKQTCRYTDTGIPKN